MAVIFLKRREIDDVAWNVCVAHSVAPLPYALTWYLDAVCPEWCGLVALENAVYQAVMPLPRRKKFGISYLEQPLFSQQYGIFSAAEFQTKEIYHLFLREIEKRFSLISGYAFHYQTNPDFLPRKYISTAFTHHIALEKDFEEIFLSFRKDRKRDFRQKNRCKGHKIYAPLKMCNIFEEKIAPKIAGGIHPKSAKIFQYLFQKAAENCSYELWETENERGDVFFAYFLRFQNSVFYLFNAASDSQNSHSCRAALIAEYLKNNCGQSLIFDFESAQKESVADFYASFGAKKVPFYVLNWDKTSFSIRLLRKFFRFFKSFKFSAMLQAFE
jgi:hypothetical protein